MFSLDSTIGVMVWTIISVLILAPLVFWLLPKWMKKSDQEMRRSREEMAGLYGDFNDAAVSNIKTLRETRAQTRVEIAKLGQQKHPPSGSDLCTYKYQKR